MPLKNLIQKKHEDIHTNRAKGRLGEVVASRFLQQKGYSIIETNFTTKFGEIDIVAKRPNGTIAFIEVKARIGTNHGFPYESVTWTKRKKLYKTIQCYLLQKHLTNSKLAFEVVSIIFINYSTVESIKHFEEVALV